MKDDSIEKATSKTFCPVVERNGASPNSLTLMGSIQSCIVLTQIESINVSSLINEIKKTWIFWNISLFCHSSLSGNSSQFNQLLFYHRPRISPPHRRQANLPVPCGMGCLLCSGYFLLLLTWCLFCIFLRDKKISFSIEKCLFAKR